MQLDIDHLNTRFSDATPADIIGWAAAEFADNVIATSSFQTQSLPLLHHVSLYAPSLEIVFLDTGFHFPQTLAYRDRLIEDLGLRVTSLTSQMGHQGFLQRYGALYSRDPDLCCFINKVDPLQHYKQQKRAWISGIRRDQTEQRATIEIVSRDANGGYKICPFATWTEQQARDYIRNNKLPEHPLLAQGYRSIGCQPCTRAVAGGSDYRAGRWQDSDKNECGLHADYFTQLKSREESS